MRTQGETRFYCVHCGFDVAKEGDTDEMCPARDGDPCEGKRRGRKRPVTMSTAELRSVEIRAEDAWEQRYKHGKASRIWDDIAEEKPEQAKVARILARWMARYEAADARAEKELRALVAAAEVK